MEAALRWHHRRAEATVKASLGKRLAQHIVPDATGFLEQAGRLDRIADWQFVPIVDALQKLLLVARESRPVRCLRVRQRRRPCVVTILA
jgi:hypothetical protein